jgi:transposase InsO family protein
LAVNLITDSHSTITLSLNEVRVIDGNFDIILGLPTIRKYDLSRKFRSLFAPSIDIDREIDEHLFQLSQLPGHLAALSSGEVTRNPKLSEEKILQYAKEDLLELLEEDQDVDLEWSDGLETMLPPTDGRVDESPLPEVHGNSLFHQKLRRLLQSHEKVFARTISTQPAKIQPMKLELHEGAKWKSSGPPRPQSLAKQKALQEFLNQALKQGLIRRSQASDYSQVVMVPKNNNKWRFCVDYRQLNEILQSMGWPIPNIDRLFQRLGAKEAKFFAVLDLTSGYHQILLDMATSKLAAFITDFGVFEPIRLWMGIKSAPSYFQQKMTEVLQGLIYSICEIYIDDIIIFGRTEEEFLENLDKVLRRLKGYNLTLNPDKAKIGLTQLEYVGRVINEHGVTMSEEKIRKVLEFPLPITPKQMKQFLGLVNYFRAHVRGFAVTAQPLYDMIEGYQEIKRQKLTWNDKQVAAFEAVKKAIEANPLLHFMDEQLPICLATDASDYGIGAYLYQIKSDGATGDQVEIPIAFLSQSLNKVQRRWSTIEKECYAIWYALKKWEHLLRDVHFQIFTDHRNLQYLNTNTPKVVRWKLAIQEYDFVVNHIEGKENVVADAFSRLCAHYGDDEKPDFDDARLITSVSDEGPITDRLCSLTGICPCSSEDRVYLCGMISSAVVNSQETATPLMAAPRTAINRRERRQPGTEDNSQSASTAHEHASGSQAGEESTFAEFSHLQPSKRQRLLQGLPSMASTEIKNIFNVDMTGAQRSMIERVHNEMEGHMGLHLTMRRLKQKGLVWPNMRQHVHKYIMQCPTCQKLRVLNPCIKALPFVTAAPYPMERISVDAMGPFTTSVKGYEYILVVIDCFSRFVELYPCISTSAAETAEKLLEYTGRYGQPSQILYDKGTQFVNGMVTELCKKLQVDTITSTPYSKEENGIVERANKEVLRHLRAFIVDEKILESWSSYLPMIQRIMNSTVHSALGVSPAEIVFGITASRLDRKLLSDTPTPNYDHSTGVPLKTDSASSPTLRAWMDRMVDAQSRLIKIATEYQEKVQRQHIQTNAPTEQPIIFQPNEYVLCEYPKTAFGKQPPNKLLSPIRGPFRVISFDPQRQCYTLQHLNVNKTFNVDTSKVRKFEYDPSHTDPAQVALADRQEFYVKAIHGVQGNPKRRSTLKFLVEWEGYDDHTWEPWSHLRHNTVLKQYLSTSERKDLRSIAKTM